MSETQIVGDILDYCEKAGIFAIRRNVGGFRRGKRFVRFGKPGQADIYGYLKPSGRGFEFEVKKPGEEPTSEQYDWLKQCAALGAHCGWGDSLEDFIGFMSHAE